MELSFEMFLLLLTVVFAQNTSDYDYETTGMEEISLSDNTTELPMTTTVKTTVSTAFPEDNYWVGYSSS